MEPKGVFRRMVQQLPTRLEIASGPAQLNGVRIEIDRKSKKASSISRILVNEEAYAMAEEV